MAKRVLLVLSILLTCLTAALATFAVAPGPAAGATSAYLRSPAVTLAVGGTHTLALRANGRIQAWGSNLYGQLGDGTKTERTTPTYINADTDWVAVACGANHSVALKANGTLWAWGQNIDGQLGLNDLTLRSAPTQVGTAADWVAVACGAQHTLALKADGSLWTWGDNTYGQLGLSDTTDRLVPTRLGGGTDWAFVAGGGAHSLALKSNGRLYAWGRNDYGQLGDGAGVEWHYPIRMGEATNWVALAAGYYHSTGLQADGSLYAWGRNNYGQLGLGTTTNVNVPTRVGKENAWVGVACGYQHTLGLKANGAAFGWGYNANGQVGDASVTTRTSPTALKSSATWASLAAGGNHSVGVAADGSVAAWGANANAQIGDGTHTDRSAPTNVLAAGCVWPAPRAPRGETDRVTCEYLHSLVVRSEGSLYSWGDATEGQVGDGTFTDRPSPVPVGPAFVWRSAVAGGFFSVALRHDGSLYTWGANNYGQLGLGGVDYAHKASPQRVGSANDWVAAAAGMYHVLALKANGTLWAWGYNFDGQLGIGNRTSTNVPTQVGSATDWVAISAGGYASHGIRADGSLYSWGNNGFGQLGLGDQTLRTTPTRVGSANTWVGVSGGGNHTLGLTVAGGAFAWGSNLEGQLGTGEGTFKTTPTAVSPATGWVGIFGGDFHSHGVRNDGTLYGWGLNSTGQLGDSSLTDRPLPTLIGSGYATATGGLRHSLLAKSTGDVHATGGNASGQLGWGAPGETSSPAFVIRLWDWISANITSPTSSSHPLQTNWYSDATADLQWTASDDSGLYGFSIAFGATPTTPDLWLDLAAGARTTTSPALPDGVNYFTIQARDAGASWSAPAMRTIRVDTTAPSAVPGLWSPTHPEAYWYQDNMPTFAWDAATDATSGIAGYSWAWQLDHVPYADVRVDGTGTSVALGPLGDGLWVFNVRAVDLAGNAGEATNMAVRIDVTDPFTSNDADALWHQGSVTVRLTAFDATSGHTFTEYRIDEGAWQRGEDVEVTLRTWKRGGNTGRHTIEYFSHDRAGNEEVTRSCEVKLDGRPPTTWCDAPLVTMPAPVNVNLTPLDADSGVAETWYTYDDRHWGIGTSITFSDPGVYALRYYSVDNAGNVEGIRSVRVAVAKFSPSRERPERAVRHR
jgi:alpha-tubulin suppressor-like RCC1 family protein